MRKTAIGILAMAVFIEGAAALAQFKPEDVAEDKKWEIFLATAEIKGAVQYEDREAVTRPYKLTLEKDGLRKLAVWKNAQGRMGGFLEAWQNEIAAYRLDRFLGLNMVPVCIERRYEGNRGSISIWADSKMPYMAMIDDPKIKVPGGLTVVKFNRAIYLERAFDNLIANDDRHGNNILVTEDWRLLLIDHSRSFRTTKKFTTSLIYTEKHTDDILVPRSEPEPAPHLHERICGARNPAVITHRQTLDRVPTRELVTANYYFPDGCRAEVR